MTDDEFQRFALGLWQSLPLWGKVGTVVFYAAVVAGYVVLIAYMVSR